MQQGKTTKKQKILDHLKSGKSISPVEALNLYGCMRLAAVIHDLAHKEGYKFKVDLTEGYAIYKLVQS